MGSAFYYILQNKNYKYYIQQDRYLMIDELRKLINEYNEARTKLFENLSSR